MTPGKEIPPPPLGPGDLHLKRSGDIYQRQPDGSLRKLRGPEFAAAITVMGGESAYRHEVESIRNAYRKREEEASRPLSEERRSRRWKFDKPQPKPASRAGDGSCEGEDA